MLLMMIASLQKPVNFLLLQPFLIAETKLILSNFNQVDVSNVGEITLWEFSGQESYFTTYHHFIWLSPYNLTAILFSLEDSPSVQIQQICFWINFLLARLPADLPTSISFFFLSVIIQINKYFRRVWKNIISGNSRRYN